MSARSVEPLWAEPRLVTVPRRATDGAGSILSKAELRAVTVWADDRAAAQVWCQALALEGVQVELVDVPKVAAHAHLVFVNASLNSQLARLREHRQALSTLPLLVVCRGLRELDQVLALEMGADDVVDVQLSAPVVAARLRALWRRQAPAPNAAPAVAEDLRFGALQLQATERTVWLNGRQVPLSEGEFEVLWLLASQAGRAVARSDILLRVRGLQDQPLDRSIDSRVYRIRAKLGDTGRASSRIRTVRNYGYAFSPRDW